MSIEGSLENLIQLIFMGGKLTLGCASCAHVHTGAQKLLARGLDSQQKCCPIAPVFRVICDSVGSLLVFRFICESNTRKHWLFVFGLGGLV